MDVLIDTNIIVGSVHTDTTTHGEALSALESLRARGDRVCLVPQNLYEFWAVATRPKAYNGLGLSPLQANGVIYLIEELGTLLRDPPNLYDVWRQLVVSYGVSGKKTHDARLVAAMAIHGITHILTFNTEDFTRYPGIKVIRPASLDVLLSE